MIEANIRVGQDMKGAAQSYFSNGTRRFEVSTPKGVYRAGGKIGDRPVLKGTANDTGLYVIIYVTGPSAIVYDEEGKFEKFVSGKGLDFAIKAHKSRGLPTFGFSENFSRYAKSLIGVGYSTGADRHFGLLTEITALANPYTDDLADGLPIYVSYRGEPRANVQVTVFERNPDGEVSAQNIQTDDRGGANVSVKAGHDYMLDSVVIRPVDPDQSESAVCEALWANLTFSVPK